MPVALAALHRASKHLSTLNMARPVGEPTLEYFPVQGRAEPIRLCMAYLGLDWKERHLAFHTITSGSERFPFGRCPTLHYGGFKVSQDMPILRYLGRVHSLYGESAEESAAVDMVLHAVEELRHKFKVVCRYDKPNHMCTIGERWHYQNSVLSPFQSASACVTMASLQDLLAYSREEGSRYVVGHNVTIADFVVYNIVNMHLHVFPDEMESFPLLKEHHDWISEKRQISDYLDSNKRPKDMWVVDWITNNSQEYDMQMVLKLVPQILDYS